jgi:hypothetical protein
MTLLPFILQGVAWALETAGLLLWVLGWVLAGAGGVIRGAAYAVRKGQGRAILLAVLRWGERAFLSPRAFLRRGRPRGLDPEEKDHVEGEGEAS